MIRLKEELECKINYSKESENNKIFSDLCSKREEATYQLDLKSRSLVEFRALKTKIDAAKE